MSTKDTAARSSVKHPAEAGQSAGGLFETLRNALKNFKFSTQIKLLATVVALLE
jgi:hypothetical protein